MNLLEFIEMKLDILRIFYKIKKGAK